MENLAWTWNIMKSPSPLFTLGSPHPPWCFPPKLWQHKLLRATDCLDNLPERIFDIWVQDPFVHDHPLGSVVTIGLFVWFLQGCSLSGWLAGSCLEPADKLPLLVRCQYRDDLWNVLSIYLPVGIIIIASLQIFCLLSEHHISQRHNLWLADNLPSHEFCVDANHDLLVILTMSECHRGRQRNEKYPSFFLGVQDLNARLILALYKPQLGASRSLYLSIFIYIYIYIYIY